MSRRNLAALFTAILLVFGLSAVAQTGQTDRQALQQICGILVNQGVATGCVTTTTGPTSTSSTTSTTLPPTTSSTTSTTLPPTTSTSTTQPPTTTSTTVPPGGQPSCAGAGLSNPGALVVRNSSLTVTQNGAIVENLEIRGQLLIQASNVTVRNVWVWYGSATYTVRTFNGGTVFDHVEVGKQGTPNARGIADYAGGSIVRNSYIHDVEDGIKMGSGSTYTANLINNLDSPNSGPHSDAMQNDGGPDNIVITFNCLDSRTRGGGLGNAALQIDTSLGSVDNVRIEGNLLNGGNYTVFWRAEPPNPAPTNGILRNDWFGCQSRYGTVSSDGNLTRSGNRWAAGCPNAGQLIPGN